MFFKGHESFAHARVPAVRHARCHNASTAANAAETVMPGGALGPHQAMNITELSSATQTHRKMRKNKLPTNTHSFVGLKSHNDEAIFMQSENRVTWVQLSNRVKTSSRRVNEETTRMVISWSYHGEINPGFIIKSTRNF